MHVRTQSNSFGALAVIFTAAVVLTFIQCSDGVLVSSHVFSNHKGGCGKTTTLFHSSSEYAMRNPEEKVLVIDTTLRGDLSELLFGGDKGAAGKQTLRAVAALRSTTRLFMQAAAVSAAAEATLQAKASLSDLIKKLFPKEQRDGLHDLFDIDDQVVHVHDFNPAIPENLYLCPGGSGPQTSYPAQQRCGIAATLRKVLEESPERWKVLCDTDGDQGFSDYTKIAHAVCDNCIIPLKTNVNDFSNRCVPMLEELYQLRLRSELRSRVQLLIWNEIEVQKNAPSEVSGLITPSKAAQGVIGMLNGLVADVASHYPDLFYNAPPSDRAEIVDFVGATTMCMRSFGVIGLAAAEHGVPFCSMPVGKLEGGRIRYDIVGETLQQHVNNVAELADRFNDPPWGRG